MSEHPSFNFVGNHAEFRPVGVVSVREFVELIGGALKFARDQFVTKLLVDVTGLTGFDPPSLGERYHYVREWSEIVGGAVSVALVTRPELIDAQKFGVLVAENAGLHCDVFATEAEALEWLEKH